MRISENIISKFHDVHLAIKKDMYNQYWFPGGRGSTKSAFISFEILLGMLKDKNANAVVFRRYQNELRDSVLGQFDWWINKLGFQNYFKINVHPAQIIYKPTQQKIIFKGADNPKKIKSINIGKGYIKYIWFEEVDQFRNYSDIRNIMQSTLRGESNYKRVTFFSFNPPKSSRSWVNQEVKYTRRDRLVTHSTYLDVPSNWLGETFITEAEHTKKVNNTAYEHEYLGKDVGTGLEVFNNITLRKITDDEINNFDKIYQGLDFGYALDPAHFTRNYFDRKRKKLYIFGEIHKVKMFNREMSKQIINRKWNDYLIYADSAEPKSIDEMKKDYGINVKGVKKGPGSIETGIKFLQELEEIIIDDERCPNTAREFINYCHDTDSHGNVISSYPDKDNHSIDANRYSLNQIIMSKGGWLFK